VGCGKQGKNNLRGKRSIAFAGREVVGRATNKIKGIEKLK
jgi:hypothetical protein